MARYLQVRWSGGEQGLAKTRAWTERLAVSREPNELGIPVARQQNDGWAGGWLYRFAFVTFLSHLFRCF